MKCERLRNSIDNSSGESPSVYLALCLIENIFRDIKDESGRDISAIAVGDDSWPIKMALIYRTLEKIYRENKDDLVRGRQQLDSLRSSSSSVIAEFESYEELYAKLSSLEQEVKEKREKLDFCNNRIENLVAESDQLDLKISEAKGIVDKLDEEKKIDEKKNLLSRLETSRASLEKDREISRKLEQELIHLSDEIMNQDALISDYQKKKKELEATKDNICAKYDPAQLERTIEKYQNQIEVIELASTEVVNTINEISSITGNDLDGIKKVNSINDKVLEIGLLLDRLRYDLNKVSEGIKMEALE